MISPWGNGSLLVINADGSGRVAILANDCSHSMSSWAPFGDGTTATPFRIINWGTFASCGPGVVADVDTVGGSIQVGNILELNIAGSYWDTQVWGDPVYGQPDWSPGTGAEIALEASWIADAATGEWVSALYVISTSEIPNPTPQLLYQPPAGCDAVAPAWNPNGTTIAFVEICETGGMRIKALDRTTGNVTTVLPSGSFSGVVGGLDWSPSGERLAFDVDHTVYTLLLDTGEHAEVGAGQGESWSPDDTDSRLAFNSSGRRKVKIIDFTTGKVTTLGNGELPDWRP